ncbi:MAG: hypothetical protein RL281_1553 [Pseudomonadota bacterium]
MNTTEELKLEPDASSFSSFKTFYPFYLNEHSNITCRRLRGHCQASVLLVRFAVWLRLRMDRPFWF